MLKHEYYLPRLGSLHDLDDTAKTRKILSEATHLVLGIQEPKNKTRLPV